VSYFRRFGIRNERLLSSYIPWSDYARDNVMLFDDRSAFVMFQVDGLPFETVEPDVLWHQHNQMELALRNMATDGLIVHTLQCRGLADAAQYPRGQFRTAFAETLDMDYRERLFNGRRMWLNQTFIGLQLRPRRYGGEWLGEQIAQRSKRSIEDESPTERIERLLRIGGIFREALRPYRPRYLRVVQRGNQLFSEIAEAVVFAMTGFWRPVPLTVGSPKHVFSEKFFVGWETFEVRMPHASSFGACLGLHDYPYMTFPGQFSQFLSAGYRHTLYNTFRCLNATDGQAVATRKQNRMKHAGDRALSQLKELTAAADLIASNRMTMGDHGFALTVFADDRARLPEVVERAWGDLSRGGIIVEREDIALEAVLFSMVPGNFRLRGRPAAISSRNFCAFAALHNFPAGDDRGFWGQPTAIFRTTAGTPYKFHLHSDGLGNCFVSGQAGSGKTVWLGFIIAQSERAGAQVIVWDKDHGLESLVLALDGVYMSLINVPGQGIGLAPLKRLTNSPEDLSFLSGLLRACIATPDPYDLNPEEDRRLGIALRQVMRLPPQDRDLGEIRSFLGTDRDGAGARLEKWIWGPGETPSGEFGWVIDCPRDRVNLDAPVIGFDQSAILTDPVAAGATMSTLFHYSGKLVDGRRLMFVLDEVWAALMLPQFHAQIHNGLKTFRKLNSPIVIATQSVADALASPIGHTIREQCPTQVYFGNPTAILKDYGEEGMHLTDREFEIVKQLPKGVGQFLLKQSDRSVVASVPLSDMDDAIAVISGTAASVRALDIAKKRSGAESGAALITEFHKVRKEQTA
jgi:type IV secretion system protein VirB4